MNPIRHALNRAFARPVPAIVLAPADPIVLPPLIVNPLDRLVYSIGAWAGDPRITHIGAGRIDLHDRTRILLIAEPVDAYLPYGVDRLGAPVWRLFRADNSTSTYWWPELVDALDDILGPAQLPTFIPDLALAILTPDSHLLENHHG